MTLVQLLPKTYTFSVSYYSSHLSAHNIFLEKVYCMDEKHARIRAIWMGLGCLLPGAIPGINVSFLQDFSWFSRHIHRGGGRGPRLVRPKLTTKEAETWNPLSHLQICLMINCRRTLMSTMILTRFSPMMHVMKQVWLICIRGEHMRFSIMVLLSFCITSKRDAMQNIQGGYTHLKKVHSHEPALKMGAMVG